MHPAAFLLLQQLVTLALNLTAASFNRKQTTRLLLLLPLVKRTNRQKMSRLPVNFRQ